MRSQWKITALAFSAGLALLAPRMGDGAAVSCVGNGGHLRDFVHISESEIEEACRKNMNAAVDRRALRKVRSDQTSRTQLREARQSFQSACVATWGEIHGIANDYSNSHRAKCEQINNVVSEAVTCGVRPGNQQECLQNAKTLLQRAKDLEGELLKELGTAREQIAKLKKANEEALSTYQRDAEKIQLAFNIETEIVTLSNDQTEIDGAVARLNAARAVDGGGRLQLSPSAGEVRAENGGAQHLKDYKMAIEPLMEEQRTAIRTADHFSSSISRQEDYHRQQIATYTEMERNLPTSLPSATLSKTPPLPPRKPANLGRTDVTPPSESSNSPSVSGSSGRSGQSGAPPAEGSATHTAGTPTPSPATPPSAPPAVAPAPAASTGNALGGAAGLAGAAGMAGAGMMAGGQSAAAPSASQPVFGSLSESYIPQNQPESGRTAAGGTTLNSESAKNGESPGGDQLVDVTPLDVAAPELPAFGIPAPGSSGGLSGKEASLRAASRSPASGGKIPSVGVSTAGGRVATGNGRGGGGKASEEAIKAFLPDLSSGALNIAGSDVNAAFHSLSEEFGGLDFSFGGQLTAGEQKAFAPLEGMGPRGHQSRGQSYQSQAAPPEPAGDSETVGLFQRTKAAHLRAVQRGALLTTVRSKL
jgi:hypothetical protein